MVQIGINECKKLYNEKNIDKAIAYIRQLKNFKDTDVKFSEANINPFIRLKIKLKEEIVTIGDKTISPVNMSGNYIEPKNWNDVIDDDNTILIDTRNDYECSIGTFKNAINPKTVKFRDFPEWVKNQNFSKEDKKNKKILEEYFSLVEKKADDYFKNAIKEANKYIKQNGTYFFFQICW